MQNEYSRRLFLGTALGFAAVSLLPGRAMADLINFNFLKKRGANFPYTLSEQEWRKKLNDEEYAVLRIGENETAGTSTLLRERRKGTYACKGCNRDLFSSSTKRMSNDYPTFRTFIDRKSIGLSTDFGIILPRTEVHCSNCGSHLGYRFATEEPSAETWRYAINGISLLFKPA